MHLLLCSLFSISMSMDMDIVQSIEQANYQKFINSPMYKSLFEHDGAYLKKILVLDKNGFCSSNIALVEVALKETGIGFAVAQCSPETKNIAQSIMCRTADRKVLLQSLNDENFTEVSKIFEKNPYVLYTYKNDSMFDQLNSAFINKFIKILSSSPSYEHCIKPLLHKGFNFDTCNGSGIPLLCVVI